MRALLLLALIAATPVFAQGTPATPRAAGQQTNPDDIDLEPLTPVPPPEPAPEPAPEPVKPPEPPPITGPACQVGPRRSMAEGPVSLGFFAADQATPRRACPRTELGLQAGGDVEIDIPAYRAVMGGGATLFGSYALNDRLEVFGRFEAFRATFAQNASLSVVQPGVGNLSGGATYVVWEGTQSVFSATGRLILPTNAIAIDARTLVVEGGGIISHRFHHGLEVHGFVGLDVAFALTTATAQPRLGLLAGAGVQWSPTERVGLVLDLQSHFGDRLPDEPIDYLAPALAVRFAATDAIGFELALGTHLLGARSLSFSPGLRTETSVALSGQYRF